MADETSDDVTVRMTARFPGMIQARRIPRPGALFTIPAEYAAGLVAARVAVYEAAETADEPEPEGDPSPKPEPESEAKA